MKERKPFQSVRHPSRRHRSSTMSELPSNAEQRLMEVACDGMSAVFPETQEGGLTG
jgi:hypothetical protein